MGKYILRRCLYMIIILLVTAFAIFTILYFIPSDPADAMLGFNTSEAEKEAYRHILGIDRPYLVQLGDFMYKTFIKLDFGDSWAYGTPVFAELLSRMPRTLVIGLSAMVLNLIFGVGLGILAGTHAGQWQDSLTMGIVMVLIACPNFWIALLMILLFSVKLNWLPPFGIDSIQCYIMPVLASALAGIAVNARFGRNSIVEVFRADYITTARSKGMKERDVVHKHMLPNALMPVVTNIGSVLTRVVAGSPVVESIFSVPGVGLYLLTAISVRDYPAIRACAMFFAVFSSIVMLIVDLVYAAIDPRIKAQFFGK
ncbi:MAG: ABC transporter permease [Lachnospiraceae bacterium]|nr:ABC transporter permease [Lachnospiraceae bacterium]